MKPVHLKAFCLLFLGFLTGCSFAEGEGTSDNPIEVWYGDQQRFGNIGEAQRWINIPGHADPASIDSLSYSINEGPFRPLSLGSDLHRLAREGDFNVELGWDEVVEGSNTLVIRQEDQASNTASQRVELLVTRGKKWPLPYSVDFTAINDLQDVVQIVDGKWKLTADGARIDEPYYDRVLSMGDTGWHNYEALGRLTIHGFTPPEEGPPTYNVSHMGVALRWRGHHTDGRQPSRKWYPLGAQGEFLLKEGLDTCRWRILFDGGQSDKPPTWATGRNHLVLGKPFNIRAQVFTNHNGSSQYRFKQWMANEPEPSDWDVEGLEDSDYPSGALCLVPHNSDVTIHSVEVNPLQITNQ